MKQKQDEFWPSIGIEFDTFLKDYIYRGGDYRLISKDLGLSENLEKAIFQQVGAIGRPILDETKAILKRAVENHYSPNQKFDQTFINGINTAKAIIIFNKMAKEFPNSKNLPNASWEKLDDCTLAALIIHEELYTGPAIQAVPQEVIGACSDMNLTQYP